MWLNFSGSSNWNLKSSNQRWLNLSPNINKKQVRWSTHLKKHLKNMILSHFKLFTTLEIRLHDTYRLQCKPLQFFRINRGVNFAWSHGDSNHWFLSLEDSAFPLDYTCVIVLVRNIFSLFRLALDLRYHELIFSYIMSLIRMNAQTFLI